MHLAIVFRRDTRQPPKDAGEMALRFKAHLYRDIGQGGSGFAQILLSALHPLAHYVLVRSYAGAHLEELGEVVLAHSGNLSQFGDAELLPDVFLYV